MASSSTVLSFDEWAAIYNHQKANKFSRGSKASKIEPPYDPKDEEKPDTPWSRIAKQDMDLKIKNIFAKALYELAFARDEDRELILLRDALNELKPVPATPPRTVSIVGQQGMGKSLLINALLHRRNLSKTSASGGACTASAIKYIHKPGAEDLSETYDALIQFMNDESLIEIIVEHAQRYFHFHHSSKVDPVYHDEEERSAKTAEDFFHMLYKTMLHLQDDNDQLSATQVALSKNALDTLTRRLSAEQIECGKLTRGSLTLARKRIEDAGADKDRAKHFNDMTVAELLERIETFISQHDTYYSLWPIVDHVEVYMGSTLLSHGVIMVDMPGLGDLNHSRTAATNSLRRKGDFEIIVAKSDRVMTEEVVEQQIKQAIRYHGAKNVLLVLTKIDEFFADDHFIETMIEKNYNHPYPIIRNYVKETEDHIAVLEQRREVTESDDDDDHSCNELDELDETYDAYNLYLKKTAQCAFVHERATHIEKAMRSKFKDLDQDPINVLSVSASSYINWMKTRQKERPILSPEMTGIPGLRRFLCGLTEEDNERNYHNHITNTLGAIIERIERITDEKKDNAYGIIRPEFLQLVASLQDKQQAIMVDFLENNICRLWGAPSQKESRMESIQALVTHWGDSVRWNTFNKVLREKGIVKKTQAASYASKGGTINWNNEICEDMHPDLLLWKAKMTQAVVYLAHIMESTIKKTCDEVRLSIENSSLVPDLKMVASEEWNKRQQKIHEKSSQFQPLFRQHIDTVFKTASLETDTRFTLAMLNAPVFEKVHKMPHQSNWYTEQRKALVKEITAQDSDGRTVLDKVSDSVYESTKASLATAFTNFTDNLFHEFKIFDQHISERLPPDYEILNLPDRYIRSMLRGLLPELKRDSRELSRPFVGVDSLPPVLTRQRPSEDNHGGIHRGLDGEDDSLKRFKIEPGSFHT
ncbi:hypothetical protein B0J11DRAFT_505324 [Dendryphion nanum]|uniref:Dynamin N-terminal domain-containing protein n=1 Tax=Dendryphion nanum TaxID=256645 RepID=A0A9P9DUW9_9PLEO|nr:hypothetical protein B0J11DRAFT_505324 [Dendryphion nanum]